MVVARMLLYFICISTPIILLPAPFVVNGPRHCSSFYYVSCICGYFSPSFCLMAYMKRSAAVNAVQEISIVECLLNYSCSTTATYILQRWNRTKQMDSDLVWKQ